MSLPPTYPAEPIAVTASFDEFNLDLTMSYEGDPLEQPLSDAGIRDSEGGSRHLAGFMPTCNAEQFDGLETEIRICNYLLNVNESK